jgi:uncharacterized protein DUF4912
LRFGFFRQVVGAQITMAEDSSNPERPKTGDAAGFRIATGPLVSRGKQGENGLALEFIELPTSYGGPILVAIPRDPQTLFIYWSIDWNSLFANTKPIGRRVYLRVLKPDGSFESESSVEPTLGTHYAAVAKSRGNYRVELGYYRPAETWHSVAISDAVTMPPAGASEELSVDVATVPFHLSFQRMVDLFRASNGNAITTILSRLEERALSDQHESLSREEWEILRAMNVSLSEIELARRAFSERSDDRLRKRAEAILGFGATSPAGGFGPSSPTAGLGGSSWSSAAS